MLLRAANPYRLVGRMLVLGAVAWMIAFGGHAYRGWQKAKLARKVPVVRVSAGMFRMGTESGPAEERPPHDVTLSSFSIDLTEVTVAAYRLCVDEGRCSPSITWDRCNGGRVDRDDHPINCVDWLQAKAFCAWAGKRLPTEEEWEYAARGRDARRWPWGNAPPGPELLNACDKECARARQRSQSLEAPLLFEASDGWATTAPVGSYPEGESAFGVLDLAGNVWEWTASPFCTYAGAPARVSPTSPAILVG